MDINSFYAECDRILGQYHEPPKRYKKRGRWGPREPGSGRYEGFGLIRWYSGRQIHVSLKSPPMNKVFDNPDDVFALLKKIVEEN